MELERRPRMLSLVGSVPRLRCALLGRTRKLWLAPGSSAPGSAATAAAAGRGWGCKGSSAPTSLLQRLQPLPLLVLARRFKQTHVHCASPALLRMGLRLIAPERLPPHLDPP